MDSVEQWWIQWDTGRFSLTQVDTVEHRWIQLNTGGFSGTQVDSVGHRWIQLDTRGFSWTQVDSVGAEKFCCQLNPEQELGKDETFPVLRILCRILKNNISLLHRIRIF